MSWQAYTQGTLHTLAASLTGSVPTEYRFTAGRILLAMMCCIFEKFASMLYTQDKLELALQDVNGANLQPDCDELLNLLNLIVNGRVCVKPGDDDVIGVSSGLPAF